MGLLSMRLPRKVMQLLIAGKRQSLWMIMYIVFIILSGVKLTFDEKKIMEIVLNFVAHV